MPRLPNGKRAGKDRLYAAAETLDADRYLLGDTMTDADVLELLHAWNEVEHAESAADRRRGR